MSEWYERPSPSEKLKLLEVFTGRWESCDIHEPMPWMKDGGMGKTINTFSSALDDFCYLCDICADTPFGDLKGHGIYFYDVETKQFRIEWYDNFGNHMTGSGDFIEETSSLALVERYRMGGVDVIERHTARLISPDSYTHIVETMIDGEFKLTSTLTYKKVDAF